MAWTVKISPAARRDFRDLLGFFFETYREFGEDDGTAVRHAGARLQTIQKDVERLALAPYQGTMRPELGSSVRHVTKGRAILYFDLDAELNTITVLAVFYGGQDHYRRMLARRLG